MERYFKFRECIQILYTLKTVTIFLSITKLLQLYVLQFLYDGVFYFLFHFSSIIEYMTIEEYFKNQDAFESYKYVGNIERAEVYTIFNRTDRNAVTGFSCFVTE